METFKKEYPLELRKQQVEYIKTKYPDRIPVYIDKKKNDKNSPDIDKKKYLVNSDLTVSNFIYIIRKRMKITPEKAIFVFVNNILPPNSALIGSLYAEQCDADGFLYMTYASEATFGGPS